MENSLFRFLLILVPVSCWAQGVLGPILVSPSAAGGGGTITLVNHTSADNTSGTNLPTFSAGAISTTNGNMIGVCVGYLSTAGTITVTDTASNTYTALTAQPRFSTDYFVQFFYAKNITGNASNVVTMHQSGATTSFPAIVVLEYSNLNTSSPADVDNKGAVSSSSPVTSQTFTTASANEAILACANTAGSGTYVAGSGYTIQETTTHKLASVEDKIVSSIQTSVTASMSFTAGTSPNNGIAAASFKQ